MCHLFSISLGLSGHSLLTSQLPFFEDGKVTQMNNFETNDAPYHRGPKLLVLNDNDVFLTCRVFMQMNIVYVYFCSWEQSTFNTNINLTKEK